MTLLDRYFLGRFLATLSKTAFSLVALYCAIDLLSERRGEILTHNIPWGIVADYYAAFAPTLLYQVAPLAVLISGLMVFGHAAQHAEIVAVLAGGVSLRRLVAYPVAAAAFISVGLFFLDEYVGAESHVRARTIQAEYFTLSADHRREGVSWANLEGGWTCHMLKFNRLALTGEHIYLYALREDANEHIVARRMYWDEARLAWIMEDAVRMKFTTDWSMRLSQERIPQGRAPIIEPPETLFALDIPAEGKTAAQLAGDIERAEERGLAADTHWVDYHAKFSYPAICFVMMWLAIPFAMRVRRGGMAIGFGLSIAIALVYLVVYGASVGLGQIGHLPPIAAAWLPNALFLAAGMILFVKTPT